MWEQFRRLIFGTVLELLLEERVPVDFSSVQIRFDERESAFKVPRFDNYMRFVGTLEAKLTESQGPGVAGRVQARLLTAWPDLLKVVKLPIGDSLDLTKNEIVVEIRDGSLRISFDLEAD